MTDGIVMSCVRTEINEATTRETGGKDDLGMFYTVLRRGVAVLGNLGN